MEQLLPREERIHWILDKTARLLDGGAEPVAGMILPTGDFFPDHFEKNAASIKKLLRRVVKHAGLKHLTIEPNVVAPDEQAGGGCSSGACAVPSPAAKAIQRVEEHGDAYVINIVANEVGNPVVLLTAMVRGVSHIFLREADLGQLFRRGEYEDGIDLAGVLLGFGTLLANGAYVYQKG